MEMNKNDIATPEEHVDFCVTPEQERSMMEDMEYLKNMCVHHIDGQQYMGDQKLPFNVSYIMPESEFINTWLIQFTLGGYYGVNYFNYPKWFEMTNNGKLCVLVIDAEKNPLFIINPITSNNLSPKDRHLMSTAARLFADNYYEENRIQRVKKDNTVAEQVDRLMEGNRKTITQLIPEWYYERCNIVPEAKQKMFYIRDVLNKGKKIPTEDLLRGEEILIKELKGQPISQEEIELISRLSNNNYHLSHKEEEAKPETKGEQRPANPLEC